MKTIKKPAKKYADGGDITMKDKSVVRTKDNTDILNRTKDKSNNSVNTRVKDNSRIKTKMDNSVSNVDKGKVKYKIAKGATVNLVAPTAKNGKAMKKAKNGTSLGMKSVKAGFDKNPGVTRADIIVAAKKEAKKGATVKKAKSGTSMKKCRYGCK